MGSTRPLYRVSPFYLALFALIWAVIETTDAFVLPTQTFFRQNHASFHPSTSFFDSSYSSYGSVCLRARKRRRKRKETTASPEEDEDEVPFEEEKVDEVAPAKPTEAASAEPRGDQAVSLDVQDIRTLVGGGGVASSSDAAVAKTGSSSPLQPTQPTASSTPTTTPTSFGTGSTDDSLQQLLADAKKMQFEEDGGGKDRGGVVGSSDEEGFSIPESVRNVISTIVTVDFFIVCIFLLWFLAGIFASSVLDNDAIQIAFNGIFEPLVQPALGILMIGALAGALFKDESEDVDKGGFNL